MIYREPGFLDVVWFGSSPTPSPVSKLSLFFSLPVSARSSLHEEAEGGEGVGEESNHMKSRKPEAGVSVTEFSRLRA
jgi:hypothetical protein